MKRNTTIYSGKWPRCASGRRIISGAAPVQHLQKPKPASSRVAFIEYPWTYADCVQCEDRSHRIGQTLPVMCTYFMGAGSIDEYMWEIINEKREVSSIITGATDTMETSTVDNRQVEKLLKQFQH